MKYIPRTFRQAVAMLLCVVMLVPMIAVPGRAAEETASGTETTAPTTQVTVPTTEATAVTTEATVPTTVATVPTTEPIAAMNEEPVPEIEISDGIRIPAYTGGTTSQTMEYDCGNGVKNDGSKSYLTIVTGTTSDEFIAYTELLKQSGYVLKTDELVEITSDDLADPNRFASFTSADGTYKLYTYHFPYYKETRIIVDTQKDTVEGFHYEAQSGKTVQPMLALYGLSMATNGYDTQLTTTNYAQGRRNCGALVVIRMPDNSLFIHDGGDIQQWSDNACNEFLAFCRELTGTTGTNEKMVINTWFLSHAHSDHFLGFPRFINKYHDHFEMKNIMYNIDIERTYTTRDIHDIMQLVSSYYPNVRYYKPHTGESFDIAGVQFDVMYTHEDRYLPNENGELITDYPTIENGQTTTPYDLGGTYRDYSYDNPGEASSESDFNDTSTVLRVSFNNGIESILYADMNRAEQTLFDIYPDSALATDIVMVPHHGFDSHPQLMAMSGATIFLYTQHKNAIYGPDDDYTTAEDSSIIRPKLRNNFIPMKEAIDATGAVEGTDYKFYWAGSETAVIDINSMTGMENGPVSSELPSMTLDTAAPGGITVYTGEPNTDVYTNAWTVYDLNDGTAKVSTATENLIGVASASTATVNTKTTHHIRFLPVTGAPIVGGRYLIRSAAYPEFVMSYSAVAETPGTVNAATSLHQTKANPVPSTNTDIFFENSEGNIYLDHSNRDNVLWIFEQYNYENGEYFTVHENYYFGGTRYRRVRLLKGTAADNAYWYAVEGNDATDPITQYRFMNPRYIAQWIRNTAIAVNDEYRNYYALEEIESGVYLIYYRASESDYRILACDDQGNWRTVRYTDAADDEYPSVSQIDVDTLAVRLYSYQEQSAIKAIDFSGSTVFNVEQGTTIEQVLFYIQQNIVVLDNARRNLPIPCSGDTAKLGYYWLEFVKPFDSGMAGAYTVNVNYRNDDGSDAKITTLTVNVADYELTGENHYRVTEGTGRAALETLIRNGITVTKTVGGTETTVSYSSIPTARSYWLQYDFAFDSGTYARDSYTVTVNYRNPDGSDTAVGTLNVVVQKPKLALTGTTTYYVQQGVSEAAVRQDIQNNITVTETVQGVPVPYASAPTPGSYYLVFDSAFNSGADGDHDHIVTVNYRHADGVDTPVGNLQVIVDIDQVTSFAPPEVMSGIVPLNAGLGVVVVNENGEPITFTVNDSERKLAVGMLTDASGNPVNTAVADTYENLTLTYAGATICNSFTLTVTGSDEALDYPLEGQPGHMAVDKQGTTTQEEFAQTGVADIELSATGVPSGKGIDLIIIMDLSGSMKNASDSNDDAASFEETRVYIMEQSLKEVVKSLQLSGADVRIAMSDFGDLDHYKLDGAQVDSTIDGKSVFDANFNNGTYANELDYYNHLNFVFRDDDVRPGPYGIVQSKYNISNPSYMGVVVPTVYTGSGEVDADAFVDVDSLYNGTEFTAEMDRIIDTVNVNVNKSLGTNYDIGLEYAYYLGYAIQQDNIAKGEDRDIVCIFMSDGAPMQYNYFSGNAQSQAWTDWITGSIDTGIVTTGYSETNLPAGLEEIEADLLELLKAGTLIRPQYHKDWLNIWLYPSAEAAIADDTSNRVRSSTVANGNYVYRMRYHNDADTYFYTFMDRQGYDLDWDYLYSIANLNGMEGFDYAAFQADPMLTGLVNKLTGHIGDETKILGYDRVVASDGTVTAYPVYATDLADPGLIETKYYMACTYTGDDFFEAMESIGIPCSWNLFARIAYANRSSLGTALTDLIALLNDTPGTSDYATHSPYSYFYNAEGKNWWAEAIKGDPTKLYPVVNKYAYQDSTEQPYTYYGDVREDYNGQKYISGFRGLGIDLYAVSFSVESDNLITAEDAETVLKNICSGHSYFFSASSQSGLTDALNSIVGSMSTSATQAWYTDTLGPQYDLYTGQGSAEKAPTVRVLEYTLDANGNRTGIPIVRETITITDLDGDGDMDAWSDQVYTTVTNGNGTTKNYPDIWNEGTNVITGRYVIYNANTTGTHTLTLDSSGRTYPLAAETFFWIIGVVGKTEMVLEYQVFLTGSDDGTLDEKLIGKKEYYDTNKEAILHYINYLGNNCQKTTVSPEYPWGSGPQVGYAFYLVDREGNPLDANGNVTDFAGSMKLSTAKYQGLGVVDGLNPAINANTVFAASGLTATYLLFDENAYYQVSYHQNVPASHYWQSNGGTTYVTNFDESDHERVSNAAKSSDVIANAYLDNTCVYFAVTFIPKVQPDTVVIDYGLPVNIDVLSNDAFAVKSDGTIQATLIGAAKNGILPQDGFVSSGIFTQDPAGEFGKLEMLSDGSQRLQYTLDSMEMPREDVFMYAAQDGTSGKYYYSTVTVIPATTIYYEDTFVTLSSYSWDYEETDAWKKDTPAQWVPVTDDTYVEGAAIIQGQDRPGKVEDVFDAVIDADHIYGYDPAYDECSQYSLGSAVMAHVDYDHYAVAEFTFYGTGFDVISLTSSQTGGITVKVVDEGGNTVRYTTVDTYYGYTQNADGEWVTSINDPAALYQVPVMEISGLQYGKYHVTIKALYDEIYDHGQYAASDAEAYDFCLDAIRIYDPANDGAGNTVIQGAYTDDGEGWPRYEELRNNVIDAAKLAGETEVDGLLFIDSKDGTASLADYLSYGPNNELYLAPGQAIVFNLDLAGAPVSAVHLGIKSATAETPVSYKIYDGVAVDTQQKLNAVDTQSVATSTGMYYDITDLKDTTIVIANTGTSGILSLTDIKITFTSDPGAPTRMCYAPVRRAVAVVETMNAPDNVPAPTDPTEETEPVETTEATEPEQTTAPTQESTEPTEENEEPKFEAVTDGNKIDVTVTTGNNIGSVTVNGSAVNDYTTNQSGDRIWNTEVPDDGSQKVQVDAFDNEGNLAASQVLDVKLSTTQKAVTDLVRIILDRIKDWFNWD